MRVLHLNKTYLPDSFTGIERVIWEICEGTARLGVENHVLSLSPTASHSPLQIGHHTAHKARRDLFVASTGLSISVLGAFERLAAQADLIHYHFPWPMMDLIHFIKRVRKPTVLTYHSDVVRQQTLLWVYRPLMLQFLGKVDRIVATSPNYAKSSDILSKFREKTSIIPIGLEDRPSTKDLSLLEYWRRRLGNRFFLFVGAPRYYKGLKYLLGASLMTGLPVVIAGSDERDLGITREFAPNLSVLGEVSEIDRDALLTLCTAFVFPSHLRSEAFGVALLEAARAGKAMISCEIGTGTSYVNVDGETGLTVEPADAGALARAMWQLWNDPQLTAKMGASARQRYVDLFTADKMNEKYLEIYKESISSKLSRKV